MKRDRQMLVPLACVCLLTTIGVLATRPREPSYHGRSLSSWLKSLNRHPPEDADARNAIRQMGSNAIPYLLSWIQDDDPMPKGTLFNALSKAAPPFCSNWFWPDVPQDRANNAVRAFAAVGSGADTAVPELNRLLRDPRHSAAAIRAGEALGYLGERGVDPLASALLSQDPNVRDCAIYGTRKLGIAARPVVPTLIAILSRQDSNAASAAAQTLSVLRLEPNLVVPALIGCLQHPNANLRCSAVSALRAYGFQAKPAVPALLAVLTDDVHAVREAATNALLKIAPEILPFAPSK
jgi:HEAT repeat protein